MHILTERPIRDNRLRAATKLYMPALDERHTVVGPADHAKQFPALNDDTIFLTGTPRALDARLKLELRVRPDDSVAVALKTPVLRRLHAVLDHYEPPSPGRQRNVTELLRDPNGHARELSRLNLYLLSHALGTAPKPSIDVRKKAIEVTGLAGRVAMHHYAPVAQSRDAEGFAYLGGFEVDVDARKNTGRVAGVRARKNDRVE